MLKPFKCRSSVGSRNSFFQTLRELLLHAAAVTTTSGIPPGDQGTIGTSRGMPSRGSKNIITHHFTFTDPQKNCMRYWKYWQMYVDYLWLSEYIWVILRFLRIQEKSTAPTAEHLRVSHGWLRKQIQWPPAAPRRTAAWTTGLGKL